MKGIFVTFEGVDGCGKSTQMRFLAEYLKEKGLDVVCTREPGGSPLAEAIRNMLLDVGNQSMSPRTEALLYAAARSQHIDEVILPALKRGAVVLCDRYLDSSLAYQGCGRQLGFETVLQINAYAVQTCMPDVTFFLDYHPEDAFDRMNPEKVRDRLELESAAFFKRVYDGFHQIAETYPERIRSIDVTGTKFETRDKLRGQMDRILEERA